MGELRDEPILVEGATCWRVAHADRAAFLVDGEAYFAAVAASIERAERSILIVGWDVHSRIRLRRNGDDDGSSELARLLDAAVRRRRGLRVRILDWDFAVIYALEREALPLLRFGASTHRRVEFRLDDRHPVGASHHQKLVVVDDAVAFAGGIDLAASRWDTRGHLPEDPRRSDPGAPGYGPFHDVQLAVDGDAARALGELARGRWERATGRRVRPTQGPRDAWPDGVLPDLRDVEVGIARTRPQYDDESEVREVEELYVRALRSAERCIYIENQYLTSARIGDVLVERLREADGPEIAIVGPRTCSGWLEEGTMGVLRARLLRRMREADRSGRLRVYHPMSDDAEIHVHAKVLVVDDRLARVGSANLSNRSMGLDTECDLVIEARGNADAARAITRFRDDLLAEHLGTGAERVAETLRSKGSLLAAIETLRGGTRRLELLDPEVPQWMEDLVPEAAVLDPEHPIAFEDLKEHLLPDELRAPSHRPLLVRAGLGIAVLLALAALWRFTPLGEWVAPERLAALAEPVRESPLGPLVALAVFVVAATLLVPVTGLIVASALVFDWAVGAAVGLAGSLATAAIGYALGAVLWRDAVRRLAGRRLNRLSELLGKRGVLSAAVVRVVPVAPFAVVNVVAGASHIRFRDYLLGTLLGMGPGTLGLALVADRAAAAVVDPGAGSLIALAAVALLLVGGTLFLRRLLARETDAGRDGS